MNAFSPDVPSRMHAHPLGTRMVLGNAGTRLLTCGPAFGHACAAVAGAMHSTGQRKAADATSCIGVVVRDQQEHADKGRHSCHDPSTCASVNVCTQTVVMAACVCVCVHACADVRDACMHECTRVGGRTFYIEHILQNTFYREHIL
jgi:hypothetical protein